MSKKIALVIGSYQPLDNKEAEVLTHAHKNSEHVIVLVGSSNRSPTFLTPFSYEERKEMVEQYMASQGLDHSITVLPLNDHLYNESQWLHEVNTKVDDVVGHLGIRDPNITLFALDRKESSNFQNKFPQYEVKALKTSGQSAADVVRDLYNKTLEELVHEGQVPETTWSTIIRWAATERYIHFRDEYEFVTNYLEQWNFAPYQPVFFTTDAVVYYKGHVLLTKRRSYPGYGMFGLPGGFLDPKKSTTESMLKNLKKDTSIEIGTPILKSNIIASRLFDDPKRSTRGRIITEASLIVLDDITSINTFPKTKKSKNGDEQVFWVPVNRLDGMANELFEDHYFIIKSLLNSVMF